jgi:hypothetical protein
MMDFFPGMVAFYLLGKPFTNPLSMSMAVIAFVVSVSVLNWMVCGLKFWTLCIMLQYHQPCLTVHGLQK